ncbi:MAG: amidohydrolase [Firmicutes bacterium]|nr:amidohydrolase [Bacillota bacterium]
MNFHVSSEQILKDWNALHQIPEIAFQEFKTSDYLKKRVEEEGFEVMPLTETGFLAKLDSGIPGPSYCLRTDIDALSFPNPDGTFEMKHACGHDAHMSMVLNAGIALKNEGFKRGILYLLFQPAEETVRGSDEIIKAGLPKLDGMFGIHLRPEVECSMGHAASRLMHNASIPTVATFHGVASHGARPHLGKNALSAAALAITMVDGFRIDTDRQWSAKATCIDSFGNLQNVVPDRIEVKFDLRAQTNDLGGQISAFVKEACEKAAETFGCTVEVVSRAAYAAEYSDDMVAIAEEAITQVFGEVSPTINTLGSEDFHAYHIVAGIPTAYIALGTDLKPGLHARDMCFNTDCMPYGAELLYRTAKLALEEH